MTLFLNFTFAVISGRYPSSEGGYEFNDFKQKLELTVSVETCQPSGFIDGSRWIRVRLISFWISGSLAR